MANPTQRKDRNIAPLLLSSAVTAGCYWYLQDASWFLLVVVWVVAWIIIFYTFNRENIRELSKAQNKVKQEQVDAEKRNLEERLGLKNQPRYLAPRVISCVYQGGHKKYSRSAQVAIALHPHELRICSLAKQPDTEISVLYESMWDFNVVTPDHPYVMNMNIAGVATNALAKADAHNRRSVLIEFTDHIGLRHEIALGQFSGITPEDFMSILYEKKETCLGSASASPV